MSPTSERPEDGVPPRTGRIVTRPNRPSRRTISIVATIIAVPFFGILLWLLLAPNAVDKWAPLTVEGGMTFLREHGFPNLAFWQAEIIANVLVFIPVGLLSFVLLRKPRRWLAFVIGPALSLTVELIQATVLADRVASASDFLLNTLGTVIGVGIAWAIARLFPPRSGPQAAVEAEDPPDADE